ncbi:MAG: DUF433 domain-containing protein [Ardenticatenales bacterium]|nr:DUF433 domain-containing protein [Ardenticatenales bacterium]
MSEHALSHVLIDPNRFNGEPYIRDTRFTVREILEMLARGRSTEEILEDHPPLRPVHIQAAAAFAVTLLEKQHGSHAASERLPEY